VWKGGEGGKKTKKSSADAACWANLMTIDKSIVAVSLPLSEFGDSKKFDKERAANSIMK
jgi:hypothetical protein